MKIRPGILAFFILTMILLPFNAGRADWIEDGIELCTEQHTQTNTRAVSDGAGGAIIAWLDYRNESHYNIYAQRLDRHGNELWATGGLGIVTTYGSKVSLKVISDGEGGAILGWQDIRNGNWDMYGIRIGPDGSPLWTPGGVAICSETHVQYDIRLVSDGAGGAIFAWEDYRAGNYDIYAQAIDAGGSAKWTPNGSVISDAVIHQLDPVLATDANGGAVIAWHDSRSTDYDIYAQRITSDGTVLWAANGLAVCTESEYQMNPRIARTDWGDFIIVWEDERNVGLDKDIYAQTLSLAGTELWGSGGVPVMTNSGIQENISVTSGEGEFVFIAWEDEGNLRVQKFGTVAFGEWGSNGLIVCYRWISDGDPQVVHDDQGGVIVVWNDNRNGSLDIYAQHIDPNGKTIWAENGIPVTTALQAQYEHTICPDGEGGLFVSWLDQRNLEYDIYAQRMERNGYWGYPAPDISTVFDVPSDQGGYVDLHWERSRLDAWPDLAVEQYSVWRAVNEPVALIAAGNGALILTTTEALDADPGSDVIRREMLGGQPFFWELVNYLDAYSLETYSEEIATMFDSTGSNEGWHYFQVIAHAEDRTIYWIGEPDSGYSVDNLAPVVPLSFAGEQLYAPEGLQLTWESNSEADLSGYRIYRGTDEAFEPGAGNMLTSIPDTFYFDGDWSWEDGYYYKLTAVDIHGNESGYSLLSPVSVTGDDVPEAPMVTYLSQNYPNPFNPNTTITFGLESSGFVNLSVYNAAGQLVAELINESRPAGQYAAVWNGKSENGTAAASGVYFYKLTAAEFVQTRKMILLK